MIVSTTCGLHKLVPFMHDIEKANPYISISRITIASSQSSFFEHSVSFEVRWPTWNNLLTLRKLEQQLKGLLRT